MSNIENEEIDLLLLTDEELEQEIEYVSMQIDDITRQLADRPVAEDYAGSESASWRNKAGIARRMFNRKRDELYIEAKNRGLNDLFLTKEQKAALAFKKAKQDLHAATVMKLVKEKEEARLARANRHENFIREAAERKKKKTELKSARYEFFIQAAYELLDLSEIKKIWDHAKMSNFGHEAFSETNKGAKDD
jgi:hypothetical protein